MTPSFNVFNRPDPKSKTGFQGLSEALSSRFMPAVRAAILSAPPLEISRLVGPVVLIAVGTAVDAAEVESGGGALVTGATGAPGDVSTGLGHQI